MQNPAAHLSCGVFFIQFRSDHPWDALRRAIFSPASKAAGALEAGEELKGSDQVSCVWIPAFAGMTCKAASRPLDSARGRLSLAFARRVKQKTTWRLSNTYHYFNFFTLHPRPRCRCLRRRSGKRGSCWPDRYRSGRRTWPGRSRGQARRPTGRRCVRRGWRRSSCRRRS